MPCMLRCGKFARRSRLFQSFGNHAMTMSRRNFLSATAALATMPGWHGSARAAPVPREADIVVIGAGAAGIAAARRIQAANRKVVVLEASDRIGGGGVRGTPALPGRVAP